MDVEPVMPRLALSAILLLDAVLRLRGRTRTASATSTTPPAFAA
jgi:hypothetical protein